VNKTQGDGFAPKELWSSVTRSIEPIFSQSGPYTAVPSTLSLPIRDVVSFGQSSPSLSPFYPPFFTFWQIGIRNDVAAPMSYIK
jgi:hypothetical protein